MENEKVLNVNCLWGHEIKDSEEMEYWGSGYGQIVCITIANIRRTTEIEPHINFINNRIKLR